MVISLQEAKDYLGIDFQEAATDRLLKLQIKTAEQYLEGSLGKGYPKKDPRVKTLALLIVAELFDKREMTEKKEQTIRRLVHDFSLQIRLEMRP